MTIVTLDTNTLHLETNCKNHLEENLFSFREELNLWVLEDGGLNPYMIYINLITLENNQGWGLEFGCPQLDHEFPQVIESLGDFRIFVTTILNLNYLYGYKIND